jgi:hypothetical protein
VALQIHNEKGACFVSGLALLWMIEHHSLCVLRLFSI